MGKVNSHFTGMGKQKQSKVMDLMNIFAETVIYTNSKGTRQLNCHMTGKIFLRYVLIKMSRMKQESSLESPNKEIY